MEHVLEKHEARENAAVEHKPYLRPTVLCVHTVQTGREQSTGMESWISTSFSLQADVQLHVPHQLCTRSWPVTGWGPAAAKCVENQVNLIRETVQPSLALQ